MEPFTIAEVIPISSSRIYLVHITPATLCDDDTHTTCWKQIVVDTKYFVLDKSEHERVCCDVKMPRLGERCLATE
jgi:hypothetical protein